MAEISKDPQQHFMQHALALAATRRGFCAPNPAVGAVVVKDNQIVGEGYHVACGAAHAEVMAIAVAGNAAAGADIYVTLEPCCHQGKTPPCSDLLIQSHIKRVFYGMSDPNPQVAGAGVLQLQAAGITCQLMSDDSILQFYQSYCHWWQKKQPWVTAKLAFSLDGKIAGEQGKPVVITGEACRQLTHKWRQRSDAILTTAQTVIADDPALNVRLVDEIIAKPIYVLDRHLRLPTSIRLLQTSKQLIVIHQDSMVDADKRIQQWAALGVRCVALPITADGFAWQAILSLVGADGMHDLWVEAGGRCFQSLWQQQQVQRVLFYLAPRTLGELALSGFSEAMQFYPGEHHTLNWQVCGDDMVMTWEIQ